ncbi:MAG: hypothetical protein F4X72_12950 [Dehalococcoidia bacterium]|nr:hypothetical protein [Dehalococcoidia bacterium]
MDKDVVTGRDEEMEEELLTSEQNTGTDWFTKLATVEKAKAIRREAQKARKGKRIAFPVSGSWSP